MPNGIKVTPEQLHQVSSQLVRGASDINGINTQLESTVSPLASEWVGLAQARFQELWAQWQHSARELNEALNGISQLMGQASTNYADAEQAIAASFGRG
jgi:WXG100 family type VII secretion target